MTSCSTRRTGSALLAVLLATIVITLLGTAFLFVTQTERGIAANEIRAAQARYAAEAGARAVKGWFERPGTAPGFPLDPATVIRDREILDEADPYGAPSIPGGPQYKEGVDHDADGRDDLFAAPYRGGIVHTFLGTAHAPDLRIEDDAALAVLSRTFLGERYPTPGSRARLLRIDVFAPPYVRSETGWRRRGVATIEVVAAVERRLPGSAPERLARRTVRLVLDELPYVPSRLEAVHSCGHAELAGPVGLHWGGLVAAGNVTLRDGPSVPASLPRGLPDPTGADRLWTADPVWIAAFASNLDPAAALRDPWVRVIAGGAMADAPSAEPQPWAGPPPPPPGTPPPWACCDRSNLFQGQTWAGCPRYDYRLWKRTARSGFRGAHYFAPHPTGGFQEDGTGPARTFDEILAATGGEPGLFFFDTADGRAPRDVDGDGHDDNLTDPIVVSGPWAARGFLFLNAERLTVTGLTDTLSETLRAPGEPANATATAWIDLLYPSDLVTPFRSAGSGEWDARGPAVPATVAFHGLFVTTGVFEARQGGTFYGALVANSVLLDGSTVPATRFYRNASLVAGWPPSGWNLPRFGVLSHEVE